MDFQYERWGSLGNLAVCNALTLKLILTLTCTKDGPPHSHPGRGRCHSLALKTCGLTFNYQCWIFQGPKNILRMSRRLVPSMGFIDYDLDTLLTFPLSNVA